jgi:hypothetical protein
MDLDDFLQACAQAHDKLIELEPRVVTKRDHRRGKFAASNTGISYGGGQKVRAAIL